MPKRVTVVPAVIKGEEFEGDELLTTEDWLKLVTQSFHNLAATFIPGWSKAPIVILTGELSQDCSSIDILNFVVEGQVFASREKLLAANKIWNFKQKLLKLKIFPLDLRVFTFGGKMWSDFVDSSQVKSMFVNEGDESDLELKDLCDQGFGGFSLRLFVAPISISQAEVSMILYPYDKATLIKDHVQAGRPEFPGVAVSTFVADLGIPASTITGKKIGCPLLPAIKTPSPLEGAQVVPTPRELAGKISALFTGVRLPEVKTTVRSLWERMAAIKKGGESQLESITPKNIWPTTEVATPPALPGSAFFMN